MRKLFSLFAAVCICSCALTAFAASESWDEDTYRSIEQAVEANTPVFPEADFRITDAKYSALVSDMEEEFFVSDGKEGHIRKTQTVRDYTKAIQAAIDDASKSGGGRARSMAYP